MFIVYVIGASSEKMLFEDKKKAFDYALEVSKETGGTQVNVYKASLIATAEQTVALTKVRKQKIVSQEAFENAKNKLIERKKTVPGYTVTNQVSIGPAKKTNPVLSPALIEIAQDVLPESEEENIPINARCSLDGNMAVGRKKGPTGEYVYLCVDCMGAVING